MLRVTPIGSCRVAGPLQRAEDRVGLKLNKARVYGYCHSSGEAVQVARFLRGEFTPKAAEWPLISRGTKRAQVLAQIHAPSDLYVVELSSAKRLTLDGVFVQLNYVNKAFARFFADTHRARAFWQRAEDGGQADIDRFLDKVNVTDSAKSTLRRLRLATTTPQQLKADLQTLQNLLPRVLVVTHVNARKPDGMPISTRSAFIEMVKQVAKDVGLRVYDPTRRMLAFGQNNALADHSAGLAHFTDRFADALCDDWVETAIGPTVDDLVSKGDPENTAKVLAPHMTALIGRTPFSVLEGRLKTLALGGADVCAISQDLKAAKDRCQIDHDAIQAAFLLDDFDQLISLITKASALPSTDQLLTYAKNAPNDAARRILLCAHSADPDNSAAANSLADLLLIQTPQNLLPLTDTQRRHLLKTIAPLQGIKLCLLYGWDIQILAQDFDPNDAAEIAAYLAVSQSRSSALAFIKRWCGSAPLPAHISQLLGQWCAGHESDDLRRIRLCRDVLSVDPQNQSAKLALRDMRRMVRADMKERAAQNDLAGLDRLACVNAALPNPLPEVNLFRARACFGAGHFLAALEIGKLAAKTMPENLSVWVLLMRAAHQTQQDDLSAFYAQQIMNLATPKSERLAQEAANRIGSAPIHKDDLVRHD